MNYTEEKQKLKELTQIFKKIFPSCQDSTQYDNVYLGNLSNNVMLSNLKQAKSFAKDNHIQMPTHIDIAFHPAQHNTCLTKYQKFIVDNFEPMVKYENDANFLGKVTEIYGNEVLN